MRRDYAACLGAEHVISIGPAVLGHVKCLARQHLGEVRGPFVLVGRRGLNQSEKAYPREKQTNLKR
jgi:hypothetical protein